MIKFAYIVPEDEAGFTKYIELTLDNHSSGKIELLILSTILLGQSEQML